MDFQDRAWHVLEGASGSFRARRRAASFLQGALPRETQGALDATRFNKRFQKVYPGL